MATPSRRRLLRLALVLLGTVALRTVLPAAAPAPAAGQPADALPSFHFFHADGTVLRDDTGRPAVLRGVAFGNQVWGNVRIPAQHHDERDFARVAAMGMNLVRFYLNYRTLEDDARPYQYHDDGWAWIDQNIAWARRHGVYLFLNFHVPPGGFQSLGKGGALWEDRELQRRLVALWRAIAARYADEPVIAGYDLVNEPGVTRSVEQWRTLAQEIARAIRTVDRRHPVIVERVNSIAGRWTNNANLNFVRIEDPNVVYTFHFYDPFPFTHQGAPWVEDMKDKVGTRWPDPARGYTRAGLARMLEPYLAWGRRENVPLYLGEFGAIKFAFENGRGGTEWVADMFDLLLEHNVPFTYHVYHEEWFGLYRGDGALDPDNLNRPLVERITQKLTGAR